MKKNDKVAELIPAILTEMKWPLGPPLKFCEVLPSLLLKANYNANGSAGNETAND